MGRRRQTARSRRSEADQTGFASGTTAGKAVRRLPGKAVWPATDNLLFQRLRALDVGRPWLSAPRSARFLQKGGVGTSHSKTRSSQKPRGHQNRRIYCRTLLSITSDTASKRSIRARPGPQGIADDGDGRGKDADGDRAMRTFDAVQLGEASSVSRRPGGAGPAGSERL